MTHSVVLKPTIYADDFPMNSIPILLIASVALLLTTFNPIEWWSGVICVYPVMN